MFRRKKGIAKTFKKTYLSVQKLVENSNEYLNVEFELLP